MNWRTYSIFAFLPFASISGIIYAIYAISSVQTYFNCNDEIGFGPHVPAFYQLILIFIRAASGLALPVFLLMYIKRRSGGIRLSAISAFVINICNIVMIASFKDEASHAGINVLSMFHPLIILDYFINFIFAFFAFNILLNSNKK